MKKEALLCVLLLAVTTVKADHLLTSLYPRDVLEESIIQPQHFAPVPKASSDFWKKTVDYRMRNSYVNNGKAYLGKPWTPIPDAIFKEYSVKGNRTNYEKLSFELRKQLACMVMAEIMQDSAYYLNDIIKGLYYFKKETWWGVPAHYPKSQPDRNLQEVDLFNAETANLLIWTCYMLEDRIKTKDRRICEDIRNEIKRRILIPARTTDYFWKRHSWNHNTWICSNWLSCILFCEDNRQQQIDDICQILKCLDVFIDGTPDDGGCDEGPNYWDRGTGSLYECMQLLSFASNGRISLPLTNKTKAMAIYIYNMYIGNGYYVNFADCNSRTTPNVHILYPLAVATNDKAMMRYAAFIARRHEYTSRPWKLFNQSGVFPALSRELCFLKHLPAFLKEEAEEAQVSSHWLKNSEIVTVHSSFRSHNTLFLAAKGGHNGENHNHNDVGNFIVYNNREPIIIDIGVGTYTSQTFSQRRYELFNCRSAYHNVPIINGYEQQEGRNYKAKKVSNSDNPEQTLFSLDLSEAYPQEAGVKKWERTILVSKENGITITEDYRLNQYLQPVEIILICCGQASMSGNSNIIINNGKSQSQLSFDNRQTTARIEKIDYQDATIQNSWKDKDLYRIRLIVKSRKLKNKISYSIN